MDEVIFEEFKGTGNMELVLDRKIADRRIFPAIDINKSGTRKEELLLTQEEINRVFLLRNFLGDMPPDESIVFLLKQLIAIEEQQGILRADGAGRLTPSSYRANRPSAISSNRDVRFPIPDSRFPMRFLAIDYGDRRIGLAVSDPTGTIASPAGFIERRRGKRPPIAEMIRRARSARGRRATWSDCRWTGMATTRRARRKSVTLPPSSRNGPACPCVSWTSGTPPPSALRTVRELGGSTRGRKGDVDALAATVLLQHALSLPR